MQQIKAPLVLAVDLGGTKIRVAIISGDGQMLARQSQDTVASEGPQAVISRIFSAIDQLLNSSNIVVTQLRSLTISAAGAIDMEKGVVTLSPNLPGWRDIALRDIMTAKYGISTFVIHDANAAALGEYYLGAGKGVKNLIYLTVSTGIGGGIIINGELYSGACGSAGEIGHMTIDVNGPLCSCGNVGCLEVLASGTAVAREAVRRISRGEKSSLSAVSKITEITAEKVSLAAQEGDPLAASVIYQVAIYLGVGMVNLVNIFNPEMIIIGGGMAKMGDLLLNPARQVVKERAFPLSAQAVRIVSSQLGDDAGLLGAALFALRQSSFH